MNGDGSTGKLAISDWLNAAAAGGGDGEELQCVGKAGVCQGVEATTPRLRKESGKNQDFFLFTHGHLPTEQIPPLNLVMCPQQTG
jgi:hypothetical protein